MTKSVFDFSAALALVAEAFKGVKDKGGVDYVKHLLHIAFQLKVKGFSNAHQIVGLLHDLMEDFPEWDVDRLRDLGCPEDILEALVLMTHVKDWSDIADLTVAYVHNGLSPELADTRAKEDEYLAYVVRLSANDLARHVKIEDLLHNSDITRLNGEDLDKPTAGRRLAKYRKALEILTGGRVGYAH